MFTGVITDVGRVRSIRVAAGGEQRLEIETQYETDTIPLGASIACSGPCLTVVDKGDGWFAVDVSRETLDRTTVGRWGTGTRINLERALRLGDELGGHMVTGHIDGVGTIEAARPEGDCLRLSVGVPPDLARFVATKGSIAIDGVSLTVNELDGRVFGVNLIPHTMAETTLGDGGEGSRVNLEIDLIARYVERLHTMGR